MMSNPPSSLQSRQKLHQRQQSTPVAFEAMKVQMPPQQIQRQNLHRRGQSYDMARSPIRRHQHTGSAVSMNTNTGSIHGQQILREAQQQRMTRPGQQQYQPMVDTSVAQQCGGFPHQQSPYDMTMNASMSIPQDMMQHSHFQNMQVPLSAAAQHPYMFDENNQHYFQALQQFQEAAQIMSEMDRRMSQPDLRIQTGIRPYTPTHQIQTAQFPLTPAQTPGHHQELQHSKSLQASPRWRQQDDNIVSPRPVSMQKSRSLQGIAEHQEVQQFVDVFDGPSLPAAGPSISSREPTKQRRAGHLKTISVSSLKDSKPLFGEVADDQPLLEEKPQPILSSSQPPSSPTRPALSPRRMSISDLNLEPGISASIEETNISLDEIAQFIEGPDPEDNKWVCKFEDCDKRFGRKENIKSHVQTHLGDRQFRCDHCNKCFVRGHDLKRHAKIHTGSKAYACLCGNAFARHDALTRHRQRGMCIGAFEGVVRKEIKRGRPRKHRPEMEDRVDKALRSRQKKQAGSSSVLAKTDAYASSVSNYSASSWGSPPTEVMDHLSIHGGEPQSPQMTYDDTMNLFGFSAQGIDMGSQSVMEPMSQVALPPDMFTFTPPASPGFSTGNKPSPSYREMTPAEMASFSGEPDMADTAGQPMSELHSLPSQKSSHFSSYTLDESTHSNQASFPERSIASFDLPTMSQTHHSTIRDTQANSLPSLSHSSSPPPQEQGPALVFDFSEDMNPLRMSTMSNISNMTFGLSAVTKSMHSDAQHSEDDAQRNDFDSFLDYNDDSQMSLGMRMDNSDAFFASL